MDGKAKILALTGKGGVGKTSLSASIVRVLTEKYPEAKILAIDADPAVGLSVALGVEPKVTLDEIRLEVADDVSEKIRETEDILAEAKFRLFDALEEQRGFAFLAVGRPEAAGCYCAINTFLRQSISLIAEEFDFVVIDGEAGIEQVNRRVMEKVTHLLCISDQSRKGLSIIKTIRDVAENLVMYDKIALVINRAEKPELTDFAELDGVPVAAVIRPDTDLIETDIRGLSVFDLPSDALILEGARKVVDEFFID